MSTNDQSPEVLAVLHLLAPKVGGRLIISIGEAGPLLGMSSHSAQNLVSRGRFPVRVNTDMRPARVLLMDVARYLVGLPVNAPRRGRPTKAEQIARRKAAEGKEVRGG